MYHGFLSGTDIGFGGIRKENFTVFVLLGTTCHSLFSASVAVFSDKLLTEKWWQTVLATLCSPATSLEVIVGFMVGSGGVHIAIAFLFLTMISILYQATLVTFFYGILILAMLATLGFGIGLLGAIARLCFEGQAFIFDYVMQAVIFFSCFYYPIEMIPAFMRHGVTLLPTYQMASLLHQIYLTGFNVSMLPALTGLAALSVLALWIPAFALDYSIRKFGIVGY
jgi:ABC-type multidrug transport system permease subunit